MLKKEPNIQDFNSDCSRKDLLAFMKVALENLSIAGTGQKNIKVKDIKILNVNTVECQFYTEISNSNDVKGELGYVVSAIYGFLIDDFFKNGKFEYYAARAYNAQNEELQYVISPVSVAAEYTNNGPIAWMQGSIFQENTQDYRLGIAKRQISEIERGLRTLIVARLQKHGDNWFDELLGKRLVDKIKDTYENQFDQRTNDGAILIEYSFILQLKKIMCTCWKDFNDVFLDKNKFEESIIELNRIRREESHNRDITHADIEILDELYQFLLLPISKHHPEVVPNYLVDNWKSKLKEIMFTSLKAPHSDDAIENKIDQDVKFEMLTTNLTQMADFIDEKIELIKSVVVPVQKRDTHDELVQLLTSQSKNHRDMVRYGIERDFELIQDAQSERESISQQIKLFIENYVLEES